MFIAESGDASGDNAVMFWGQDRLQMVEAALGGWRPDSGKPPQSAPSTQIEGSGADATVHFFYDFSSPYAYLGSTQIEKVAARASASLRWRPMLLGAVFKEIGAPNVPLLAWSDSKRRYFGRDLHHWAAYWGIDFRFSSRFPMRSITALRMALQAGDRIGELSHAIFDAAWAKDTSIEDEESLKGIVRGVGLDADALLAGTRDPAVKQMLIDNTAEAIRRGVFGAPACIVERDGHEFLFWGQDRLELVERAALGWTPPDSLS